jgi:hypothetical protein
MDKTVTLVLTVTEYFSLSTSWILDNSNWTEAGEARLPALKEKLLAKNAELEAELEA